MERGPQRGQQQPDEQGTPFGILRLFGYNRRCPCQTRRFPRVHPMASPSCTPVVHLEVLSQRLHAPSVPVGHIQRHGGPRNCADLPSRHLVPGGGVLRRRHQPAGDGWEGWSKESVSAVLLLSSTTGLPRGWVSHVMCIFTHVTASSSLPLPHCEFPCHLCPPDLPTLIPHTSHPPPLLYPPPLPTLIPHQLSLPILISVIFLSSSNLIPHIRPYSHPVSGQVLVPPSPLQLVVPCVLEAVRRVQPEFVPHFPGSVRKDPVLPHVVLQGHLLPLVHGLLLEQGVHLPASGGELRFA